MADDRRAIERVAPERGDHFVVRQARLQRAHGQIGDGDRIMMRVVSGRAAWAELLVVAIAVLAGDEILWRRAAFAFRQRRL